MVITHNGMEFESREDFELFKRKHPLKYKPAEFWGVMPEFYFVNRDGSDAVFIDGRLSRMSDENRRVIASDYREVFLKSGRKVANEWLDEQCGIYGITKSEWTEAKRDFPHRFEARIGELKKLKKRSRSKYSKIFYD